MTEHDEKPKAPRSKSIFRRAAVLIGRTTLTGLVIAGAVLAVRFGADELGKRAEAAPLPDAAPTVSVAATPLQPETGYTIERAFIGQVEAQKSVSISFELPGRLAGIHVDEGDEVVAGQVLAEQDTSLLKAERTQLLASKTAAEAQLRFAVQTLDRSEELNKRGFASKAGVDEASSRRDELLARIAEIEASLLNLEIRTEKARITAPFDGRVTSRQVDGGETLGAGQAVLGLVETRAPQVRIGVPLDLEAAALDDAVIEVAGAPHPATLVQLRPDIDPVTRTRTAIFGIETDAAPAFGQTARLLVREEIDADGLWVPLTSLKEGVRGQWTVLMVDPESTVRAASVEVLHAETDRVYVRGGFPEGTQLIEAGPQRVTVGQRVSLLDGS